MEPLKRLYIFTGKGGVGKTTTALAFTKYLQSLNKKVLYNSFDQESNKDLSDVFGISRLDLDLNESIEEYMGRVLNSKMIASWIMKTPFFKSLFNMLPGLGHLILLGHIIDRLEEDPELIVILDSPSSGHALTMLQATHNFKEIFGTGLLVKDIDRMHNFLLFEGNLQTNILTLPSLMAVSEAIDLKNSIEKLNYRNINTILNNYLPENESITIGSEELPNFLQKKVDLETDVFETHTSIIDSKIPYLNSLSIIDTIDHLEKYVEGLR